MHSGRKFFNPKLLVEMEGSIIVGCPLCNCKCVEMRRKKESHAHTHSPCLAGLGGTGRAMTRRGEVRRKAWTHDMCVNGPLKSGLSLVGTRLPCDP
jgi:hypothetical protein